MAGKKELKYKITADSTDFEKKMQKVLTTTKTVGKGIGIAVGAGAVAGAAAIAGMTKVMSEAVELANVQEEAETKLGAVLKATGEAAGFNKDQMIAMAGALQGITTVGDETIIAGQAILATFKDIKGEAFEGATKAALDMSAVMGQDLKSSIVQIGKALNDPTKGLTALTRVGVSFTEQQKDQIKVLQESGDILGAQKIILAELNSEFGGAAESLRGTFKGSVMAAQNAFGDLQEQIGFTITKNQFFIESAQVLERVFIEFTGYMKDNQEAMNALAKSIGLGLIDALDGAIKTIGFFHVGWLGLKTVVPSVVNAFEIGVEAIYTMLRNLLFPLDAIFSGIEKVAEFVGKDFTNPFDVIQGKLDEFGNMTRTVMEESFQEVIDASKAYDAIGEKIGEIRGKLSGLGTSAYQNEYIDSWQKAKKAVIEHNDAVDDAFSPEQLKKFASAADGIEDMWLSFYDGKTSADQQAIDEANKAIEDQLQAQEDFYAELETLKSTDTETAIRELDKQLAKWNALPDDIKPTAEEISEWYKLKLEEITDANNDTTDAMSDSWSSFNDEVKGTLEDTLSSAFKGEFDSIGDAWDELMDSMADKFAEAAADMAIDELFSDSGGDSDSGSLWDSISSLWSDWHTGGYLSPSGTKYYADGGGVLQGGSGVRDDLYLGKVNGANIVAQGGEFIVNPLATSQNLGLLHDINSGKIKGYANGGQVDGWNDINSWDDFVSYLGHVLQTQNSTMLSIAHALVSPQSFIGGLGLEVVVDGLKWVAEEISGLLDSWSDEHWAESLQDVSEEMAAMYDAIMTQNETFATTVDVQSLAESIDESVNAGLESQAQSLTAALNAIDADIVSSLASQNSEAYNANSFALPGSSDSNEHYFGLSSSWYSNMYGSTDDGMSSADVGSVGDHESDDTHAAGGVIDSVYLSDSMPSTGVDDGWAKISMGEGVIDADTMKILSSKIRNGELGGGNTVVKVYLGDKEIKRLVDDVVVTRGRQNVSSASRLYI